MSQLQAPYITVSRDYIMDRYAELSLLNIIPDMRQYATEWQRLAMKAQSEGRISTAWTCRRNARHYWEMTGGEYIRLVEGCFAELILVTALPESGRKG